MIITVDESSKDGHMIFQKCGHAPKGHHAIIDADFVRGDQYSLLAALSVEGFVGTRAVEGSIDGDEFFDFIVDEIVCDIAHPHYCSNHTHSASSNESISTRS